MQFIMLKILSLVRAFLTATTSEARIDTHIHALPQVYLDAVSRAGGDPSGFPTPEWSIEETLRSMDRVGTSHGMFIFTHYIAMVVEGVELIQLSNTLNINTRRPNPRYNPPSPHLG